MPSILDLYYSAKIQKIDEAAIEMERNGYMLDADYCNRGAEIARADEEATLAELHNLLDTKNILVSRASADKIWSSHPQLTFLLEKELGLPPSPYKFKGKVNLRAGERSTDKTALGWILGRPGIDPAARRVVEGIIECRRIRSSLKYLEKLPRFIGPDGFIHPVCGPAGDEDDAVGAITGRFGMKKPEGQQIPKDPKKDRYLIRRAFIAPPGQKLIVADYTALEVIIMANICDRMFGDSLLLDLTMPGTDIHAYNAYRIFGTLLDWRTDSGRRIRDYPDPALYKSDPELNWYRELVKSVWYKLMYGGTVYGFAISLKDNKGELLGERRAKEILDALYEACPPVKKLHAWVADELKEYGAICGLDGREINYADLIARGDWGFAAACRKGDNAPMQVTGAAVIGSAMVAAVESRELRELKALLQLQIHDELQWRAPEVNAPRVGGLVKEIMEGAYPLKNLMATVAIGDNWRDCKGAK